MPADRFAFVPDAPRTALIDADVRRALGDSVARVLDVAQRFGIACSGDLPAWRRALEASPGAPPTLWAVYHDLVQALRNEDAPSAARLATDLLARTPGAVAAPGSVVTLTDADFGPDLARSMAVIDNDPSHPLALEPASPAEVARIRRLTAEARALLGAAQPVLLDEVDTLGRTLILATGRGVMFGGAATVFLWGAVVLNPVLSTDRISLAENLAHETAHALLFGLTVGADLTLNDPEERFASPLRRDPRPIEGIVHAAYVLARMAHAMAALRGAPGLSAAERVLVETKLAKSRSLYASALPTVNAHARFTDEGAAIFDACRQAMG